MRVPSGRGAGPTLAARLAQRGTSARAGKACYNGGRKSLGFHLQRCLYRRRLHRGDHARAVASENETGDNVDDTSKQAGSEPVIVVNFSLKSETAPGQDHLIVGSCPGLGEWNVESALELQWTDGHFWRGQLEVPTSAYPCEFKCIKKHPGGGVEWQSGDNLTLGLPSNEESAIEFTGVWINGAVAVDEKPAAHDDNENVQTATEDLGTVTIDIDADADTEDLRSQLESVTRALQEERAAREHAVTAAEQERDRLLAELSELQSAVTNAAEDVQDRTSQALEGSHKEVADMRAALEREKGRASARQAELERAKVELLESKGRVQQNDKDISELKAKLEISKYACKKTEQRCEVAEKRLEEAEARLASEQKELGAVREEAEAHAKKASDVESELHRLRAEHQTSQGLREELAKARDELKIALAKLRSLQQVLADRNQCIADLKLQMERQRIQMVGELAQERARIIVLKRRCSESKAQEDRMRLQRDTLAVQLGGLGVSAKEVLQNEEDWVALERYLLADGAEMQPSDEAKIHTAESTPPASPETAYDAAPATATVAEASDITTDILSSGSENEPAHAVVAAEIDEVEEEPSLAPEVPTDETPSAVAELATISPGIDEAVPGDENRTIEIESATDSLPSQTADSNIKVMLTVDESNAERPVSVTLNGSDGISGAFGPGSVSLNEERITASDEDAEEEMPQVKAELRVDESDQERPVTLFLSSSSNDGETGSSQQKEESFEPEVGGDDGPISAALPSSVIAASQEGILDLANPAENAQQAAQREGSNDSLKAGLEAQPSRNDVQVSEQKNNNPDQVQDSKAASLQDNENTVAGSAGDPSVSTKSGAAKRRRSARFSSMVDDSEKSKDNIETEGGTSEELAPVDVVAEST